MRERRSADRREEAYRAMRASGKLQGTEKGRAARKTESGLTGIKTVILAAALLTALIFARYAVKPEKKVPVSVGDRSANEGDDQRKDSGASKAQEKTAPETYEVPRTVRVVLMNSGYSSIYHEHLTLDTGNAQIEITAAGLQNALPGLCEALLPEGIMLEQTEDHYLLKAAGDQSVPCFLKLSSVVRACGAPSYRGTIELYIRGEALVLVNELLLEEYLYSVLPSEMPSTYHEEALKAQAVCARSFACAVMENPRYPEYGAQLDDSTSCQVYGNLPEHEAAVRAVDDTKGEILLFQGKPVSTYYYSTSCGIGSDIGVWQGLSAEEYPYLKCRAISETAQSVFLSESADFQAYLESQHGDYESDHPWYRWECTVSEADVDLMYQKLKERWLVKKESVQPVTNRQAVAKRTDRKTGQTQAAETDTEPVHPGKLLQISVIKRNDAGCAVCLYIEGTECGYLVWGEYNIRYLLCDNHTQVRRQDGSSVMMSSILPSAYIILTPIMDKDGLIGYSVKGGGYGHGVGLSQNGADRMASRGMSYPEILMFFYEGTQLKRT